MSGITCCDSGGSPITRLYQWDVNISMTVTGLDVNNSPSFHFCNRLSNVALIVTPSVSGSSVTVQIPNILLQSFEPIIAYVYYGLGNDGYRTMQAINIPVMRRPRPADYEFEENIEYISAVDVNTRLTAAISSLADVSEEVSDIRIGSDGTIYNSAGDAIRDIASRVESIEDSLEDDYATTDYVAEFVDENGGKINTIRVNGAEQSIESKSVDISVPTKVSELENDSEYLTEHQSLDDYATKEDVDTAVADLVGAAPGALDTLNELADALGDDPNFATTVITELSQKANINHDHDDTYLQKQVNGDAAKFLNEQNEYVGVENVFVGEEFPDGADVGAILIDPRDTVPQAALTPSAISSVLGYVPAAQEGTYELIETITLTEDTASIVRTQEPDGTDYRFSALRVPILATQATGNSNVQIKYTQSGGGSPLQHPRYALSGSGMARTDEWLLPIYGYYTAIYSADLSTAAMVSARLSTSTNNSVLVTGAIESVTIGLANDNIPIPAGTEIQIWAVRA